MAMAADKSVGKAIALLSFIATCSSLATLFSLRPIYV